MSGENSETRTYMIVSTDLAGAFGPIIGLDLAAEIAEFYNQRGDHTYIPVPFFALTETKMKAAARGPSTTDDYKGGQYL